MNEARGDVLLYDGHCRICCEGARQVKRLEPAIELRSFRDEGALVPYPSLTMARCERAMQLVRSDGRIFEGAEAAVQALRGRLLGKLARVYYLPGLRRLLDAAYDRLAEARFRIAGRTCQDGTCAVHLKPRG